MANTKRSSDCPRCLKRVKLVGSRGVMPRHLDPQTREVCRSSGHSPADAAKFEAAAASRVAAAADDAVAQLDRFMGATQGPARRDIHDQHGCEGCSVCEPWTDTHAAIDSIRTEVIAIAAHVRRWLREDGDKLDAVAVRLAALLPPTEDVATDIDEAIDLGHSN
jgi:hypothetical protein